MVGRAGGWVDEWWVVGGELWVVVVKIHLQYQLSDLLVKSICDNSLIKFTR